MISGRKGKGAGLICQFEKQRFLAVEKGLKTGSNLLSGKEKRKSMLALLLDNNTEGGNYKTTHLEFDMNILPVRDDIHLVIFG